jgi:two-component sensor histidine kinase
VVTIDGRRALHLQWRERNGPPVDRPAHHGFGLTLLERILQTQSQAQVRLAFDPAGLQVEIELPLMAHRLVPED